MTGSGGASQQSGSGGAPGSGGAVSSGGAPGSGGTMGQGSGGASPGTGGGSGGAAAGTGGTDGSDAGTSPDGGGGTSAGGAGGGNMKGTGGAGGTMSGAGGRNGRGGATVGTGGAGATGGAAGNLKATMVVRGAGTATAGDLVMIGRIKAHGFAQVTLISDALATAESAAGQDLVIISSSSESGPLQAKLKDVAVPVLVIEDAEFKLMGMSTSGNHDANVSQVTIVPAGSALIGAATGMVTFASRAGDLGWAAGTNAATVVIGATMPGDTSHAAIFGYPKGAQMAGGMVAPAKRAGFAIRETLAANLNADGIKLFDAILDWILR